MTEAARPDIIKEVSREVHRRYGDWGQAIHALETVHDQAKRETGHPAGAQADTFMNNAADLLIRSQIDLLGSDCDQQTLEGKLRLSIDSARKFMEYMAEGAAELEEIYQEERKRARETMEWLEEDWLLGLNENIKETLLYRVAGVLPHRRNEDPKASAEEAAEEIFRQAERIIRGETHEPLTLHSISRTVAAAATASHMIWRARNRETEANRYKNRQE